VNQIHESDQKVYPSHYQIILGNADSDTGDHRGRRSGHF
jgi:hypothetical protein